MTAMICMLIIDSNGLYFLAAAKQAVHSRRTVPRSSHLHHCNSWA